MVLQGWTRFTHVDANACKLRDSGENICLCLNSLCYCQIVLQAEHRQRATEPAATTSSPQRKSIQLFPHSTAAQPKWGCQQLRITVGFAWCSLSSSVLLVDVIVICLSPYSRHASYVASYGVTYPPPRVPTYRNRFRVPTK